VSSTVSRSLPLSLELPLRFRVELFEVDLGFSDWRRRKKKKMPKGRQRQRLR